MIHRSFSCSEKRKILPLISEYCTFQYYWGKFDLPQILVYEINIYVNLVFQKWSYLWFFLNMQCLYSLWLWFNIWFSILGFQLGKSDLTFFVSHSSCYMLFLTSFCFHAGGLRFLVQFSITYTYGLVLYYIYGWCMITYMYNHTYMYDFNDLTILQPKYFT